jgi:cytochrome c-type biogenesis protein CcmH/NrfG
VASTTRTYGLGHLIGVAVAAPAVGFYLRSVFMSLREPPVPAGPPASVAQSGQPGPGQAAPAEIPPKVAAQIAELEQAVAAKPGDQSLWIDLGNLYFDAQQAAKAASAYEKAVVLGPVSADVWTDLGIMHRETGNAKKAVECFDAAVKLDPRHENALYNKGVVLLHDVKDRAGALSAWESLLLLNPMAKNPEGKPLRELVDQLRKS